MGSLEGAEARCEIGARGRWPGLARAAPERPSGARRAAGLAGPLEAGLPFPGALHSDRVPFVFESHELVRAQSCLWSMRRAAVPAAAAWPPGPRCRVATVAGGGYVG